MIDRKYMVAEHRSHDMLLKYGYRPQGIDADFKHVVVMKIENENTNEEKREVYSFKDYQEAAENLCK